MNNNQATAPDVDFTKLGEADTLMRLLRAQQALGWLLECTKDADLSPSQREVWGDAAKVAATEPPGAWRDDIARDADVHRFLGAVAKAYTVGRRAANKYGQRGVHIEMCVETCGELITAIAQMRRERAEQDEVIDVAAAALIRILQLGVLLGGSSIRDLTSAVERKTARIAAKPGQGACEL